MIRQATKTVSEREDEESDRLVRPAPKQKPPRNDRRRERMDVEEDPDLEDSDPDTSMNYKTIGGSDRKKVPAKNKDNKIVYVSPQTLKDRPGEYQAVKETKELYDQASPYMSDDEVAGWADQMETLVRQNPEKSVDEVFPKGTFPEQIKTLGDLVALFDTGGTPPPTQAPPAEAPPKAKPSLQKAPEAEAVAPVAEPKAAPAQEAPQEQPVVEEAPPAAAEAPSETESESEESTSPKEEATAPDDADKATQEEKPSPPQEQQQPSKKQPVRIQRPEASAADWKRASLDLIDLLPPAEAAAILAMPDMHPQDINRLTRAYKEGSKTAPPKGFKGSLSVGSVSLPAEWEGKPTEGLSDEEKASITRMHAMETVGRTIGARNRLERELQSGAAGGKISEEASKQLSQAMLGIGSADPSKLMDEGLKNGPKLSKREKRKLLKKYPDHREAIAAYLQGTDIKKVKDKYIGSGWGQVSEFSSTGAIARSVGRAVKALNSARKIYQTSEFDELESAKLFKSNLLANMRQLRPKKYEELKAKIQKLEDADYRQRVSAWQQAHKAWARDKEKFEAANKGGYRKAPGKFSVPEPVAPKDYVAPTKSANALSRAVSSYYPLEAMSRQAVYHGVDPEDHFLEVEPVHVPHPFDSDDEKSLIADARKWLRKPLLKGNSWAFVDQKFRMALDLAIHNSPLRVPPPAYNRMLFVLMDGAPELKQARSVLALAQQKAIP